MNVLNLDNRISEFLLTQSHFEYREDCSDYGDASTVLHRFKLWVAREYRPESKRKKVHYLLTGDGAILCTPNSKLRAELHTVLKSRVTCKRCISQMHSLQV
jgi:hypothetical protein